jgi:hypothetical protein
LHIGRSLKWWYWLAAALALSAAIVGWPRGLPLAFAMVGGQAALFLLREGRPSAFSVQVPMALIALLAIGLWGPLGFIHWMQLAGTWVRLVFDYCPLARIMSLMPWNLREPLSLRLVKRTFLARPVTGSILGKIPVRTAAGGSAAQPAA